MTRPDDTHDPPDEEGRDDLTWTGGDADDAPRAAAVPEYGAAEHAEDPGGEDTAGTGDPEPAGGPTSSGGEPGADEPAASREPAAADAPAADDDAPGSVAPPGEAPSRGGPRRSGGLLDTLRRRLNGD